MPKKNIRFATKSKAARTKLKSSRRPAASTSSSIRRLVPIMARRALALFPKTVSTPADPTPLPAGSWLDRLAYLGTVAAKLIITAITMIAGPSDGPVIKKVVVSTNQCFLIGLDELFFGNPLATNHTVQYSTKIERVLPSIPYKQGRIASLSVNITPSAELSKRGGTIAAALVPLTREESLAYHTSTPGRDISRRDMPVVLLPTEELAFANIIDLPGAIVKPTNSNVRIRYRTSGFAAQFHRIGSELPKSLEDYKLFLGGPFLFKLYVAYEDRASTSEDPTQLYSPEEAMLDIKLSADVKLTEFGDTYLRWIPAVTIDANTIAVTTPETLGKIAFSLPIENFINVGGKLEFVTTPPEMLKHIEQFYGTDVIQDLSELEMNSP
jgi:hypothetical protein